MKHCTDFLNSNEANEAVKVKWRKWIRVSLYWGNPELN